MSIKLSTLVYLRDNPAAQRLAVAWPLVDHALRGKALIRAWARLADVPPHVTESLAPVLRAHGICLDDGTTDPLAEQYVGAQMQTGIRLATSASRRPAQTPPVSAAGGEG